MPKKREIITRDDPRYPEQKSRNLIGELYLDNPAHAEAIRKLQSSGYLYAGIVHDKDKKEDGTPKKPHFHFVVKFSNGRHINAFCAELGIPDDWRYVEIPLNFNSCLRYLVHADDQSKYQYDVDEVEGPLAGAVVEQLQKSLPFSARMLEVLNFIDSIEGPMSYSSLCRWACESGYIDVLNRNNYGMQTILREHNNSYRYK